jgi:hypothetical protein
VARFDRCDYRAKQQLSLVAVEVSAACTERLAAEGARVAFSIITARKRPDNLVAGCAKGHEVQAIQADVVDTERAREDRADLLAIGSRSTSSSTRA